MDKTAIKLPQNDIYLAVLKAYITELVDKTEPDPAKLIKIIIPLAPEGLSEEFWDELKSMMSELLTKNAQMQADDG